jgi:hypothetical protein
MNIAVGVDAKRAVGKRMITVLGKLDQDMEVV